MTKHSNKKEKNQYKKELKKNNNTAVLSWVRIALSKFHNDAIQHSWVLYINIFFRSASLSNLPLYCSSLTDIIIYDYRSSLCKYLQTISFRSQVQKKKLLPLQNRVTEFNVKNSIYFSAAGFCGNFMLDFTFIVEKNIRNFYKMSHRTLKKY